MYEIKNGTVSPLDFDHEKMDVFLEVPIVDYIRFCEIKPLYLVEQVADILAKEDICKTYNKLKKNIEEEKNRLKEWDERGREVHNHIDEKIQWLSRELNSFVAEHPDIEDL